MKHVFYALFDTRDAVDAALRDLSAYRITEAQCSIVIHNGPPIASELNASESDAREGIITGLLLGGAFGGLLAGALAIALDAIPMDPIVTTLIGAVGASAPNFFTSAPVRSKVLVPQACVTSLCLSHSLVAFSTVMTGVDAT